MCPTVSAWRGATLGVGIGNDLKREAHCFELISNADSDPDTDLEKEPVGCRLTARLNGLACQSSLPGLKSNCHNLLPELAGSD